MRRALFWLADQPEHLGLLYGYFLPMGAAVALLWLAGMPLYFAMLGGSMMLAGAWAAMNKLT